MERRLGLWIFIVGASKYLGFIAGLGIHTGGKGHTGIRCIARGRHGVHLGVFYSGT